jgi:type III secretion protein J
MNTTLDLVRQNAAIRRASGARACVLALLTISLLAGCKQPIYTRLSEAEANDVLLTLIKGGVEADKRAAEEGMFSVWVSDAEIATAIELLRADAQPSEHYTSLGEVFARNGLVSSPTEERIRFIYGLQQELAKTLSQIDGVLVARVHIVVPASDPFAASTKPASASVFLKHRADMNMQLVVPSVKDLVVRSVEGLAAESVSVSLFPARTTMTPPAQVPVSRFFGALVASRSVATLWIVFTIPWLLVAALIVMLLRPAELREAAARWIRARRGPSQDVSTATDESMELQDDGRRAA